MKRARIQRQSEKVLSASCANTTFYLPKPQNTIKRKTVYDLFKS